MGGRLRWSSSLRVWFVQLCMVGRFEQSRIVDGRFGGKRDFGRWWVVVCGKRNLLWY
jgi:hypothetical protein